MWTKVLVTHHLKLHSFKCDTNQSCFKCDTLSWNFMAFFNIRCPLIVLIIQRVFFVYKLLAVITYWRVGLACFYLTATMNHYFPWKRNTWKTWIPGTDSFGYRTPQTESIILNCRHMWNVLVVVFIKSVSIQILEAQILLSSEYHTFTILIFKW